MRCDNKHCLRRGLYQWHNYYVDAGKHVMNGSISDMNCLMLTASFGVSICFLEQMHLRMLREHVSFAGEADVAHRYAKQRGSDHSLPKRLRLYLSQAWYFWRLAWRKHDLQYDAPDLDISRPVEEHLASIWPKLEEGFEARTAQRARRENIKTDVQVIDGNAKNRRLVCAAAQRHMIICPNLDRKVCVGCPHTPLLGSCFCSDHYKTDETGNQNYEIIAHEASTPGGIEVGDSLRLLVRETDAEHRELWLSEDAVAPGLVAAYFKELGQDRLAAAAGKRHRRMQERQERVKQNAAEMTVLSDIWSQFTKEELEEILADRSKPEDLEAVTCNTHKETEALTRQCAKSAGLLCACLSNGIVTSLKEIYGCESLSQRYFFVSSLVKRYPEIKAIIHDDACHLHKFCEARAASSASAARLAPPMIRYICDIFHMVGHIDPWCKIHCNPASPDLKPLVEGVRTSVCEFTFTWFSQYKHQSKHMSEWGFKFFLQEMCAAHNEAILDGDTTHLTHRLNPQAISAA